MKPKEWSRRSVIRGTLSIILLIYLIFAFRMSANMHANEKVGKINFIIEGENNGFVTEEKLMDEVYDIKPDSTLISSIDFSRMERILCSLDKIESANVSHNVRGDIYITVTPMIPVARVFDSNGYSYYINKDGKKLDADIKYHIDVPVISGFIDDSLLTAVELLPLLQYVSNDSLWNRFTTAFHVEKNHDLLLIPITRGHVVNLGDGREDNFPDKFNRLKTFYKEVVPYKGWQFYDTISVKYRGQVVATRTKKRQPTPDLLYELADSEEVNIDNMIINEQ